jgi:hypothetical protein
MSPAVSREEFSVTIATRKRAVDVLSLATAGVGILVAVLMPVGVFVGLSVVGVVAALVVLGLAISIANYAVYKPEVEHGNEDIRNFMSMLADLCYLTLSLIGFVFSGLPWAWVSVVVFVAVLAAGLVCIQFEHRVMFLIGFMLMAVSLAVALVTLAALAMLPFGAGQVVLSIVLTAVLMTYGLLVVRRVMHEYEVLHSEVSEASELEASQV